jgi:ketosteroid isomerase-like protein
MRECEQSGGYNMQSLNAIQLREMVETKYFGNVDMKFLEATADCFDPDATFTIQTANLTHNGISEIRRMFNDFFSSYKKIWHGEFHHVIDIERQAVAVQFIATRDTFDGEHQRASNCNFFHFENGKIKTVRVYMSDENPLV